VEASLYRRNIHPRQFFFVSTIYMPAVIFDALKYVIPDALKKFNFKTAVSIITWRKIDTWNF